MVRKCLSKSSYGDLTRGNFSSNAVVELMTSISIRDVPAHGRQKVVSEGLKPTYTTVELKSFITHEDGWGHNAVRATSKNFSAVISTLPSRSKTSKNTPAPSDSGMDQSIMKEEGKRKGSKHPKRQKICFCCGYTEHVIGEHPCTDVHKAPQSTGQSTSANAAQDAKDQSTTATTSSYCPLHKTIKHDTYGCTTLKKKH